MAPSKNFWISRHFNFVVWLKYLLNVLIIFFQSLISAMKRSYSTFSELQSKIYLDINLFEINSFMLIFYFQKYFRIALSFFSKLSDENKFVKSVRLLPLNIKSRNPMEKDSPILSHRPVFYRYLLWYLCYQWFFLFLLECIQHLSYQSVSRYFHLYTKLSNEFLWFVIIKIYYVISILRSV